MCGLDELAGQHLTDPVLGHVVHRRQVPRVGTQQALDSPSAGRGVQLAGDDRQLVGGLLQVGEQQRQVAAGLQEGRVEALGWSEVAGQGGGDDRGP